MNYTQIPHSLQKFFYNKNTKTLSAEISESGINGFEKLYADAEDRGVVVQSHVTGKITAWVVFDVEANGFGEILVWKLKPTAETIRRMPLVACINMVIFNL